MEKNDPPAVPENFVTIAQLKQRWIIQKQLNALAKNDPVSPNNGVNTVTPTERTRIEFPKFTRQQQKNKHMEVNSREGHVPAGKRYVPKSESQARRPPRYAYRKKIEERVAPGEHVPESETHVTKSESHAPRGYASGRRSDGEVILESKVLSVELGEMSLSDETRVINRGSGMIRVREYPRQGRGKMVWVKKAASDESADKFPSSRGISIADRR